MDSIRLVTQEEISSRCIQGRKHSFRDDKETQLWELEDIEDLTSRLDTRPQRWSIFQGDGMVNVFF